MLNYEIGFSVLNFDGKSRSISQGLYFQGLNSLIAFGMNPCDYLYTSEVIENLEKLLIEELCEYEWGGGERTWFVSEPELTIVKDNFLRQKNIELPTYEALELMKMRKQLMNNRTKEYITSLIKNSFNSIKESKSFYQEDENGSRYKMLDKESGLLVSMILLENDLNLTSKEYCNQLKFNERFFPPQNKLI